MKRTIKILLLAVIVITNVKCHSPKQIAFKSKEVYKSASLIVTQITPNAYLHTSFKQTNDFGNVPCNGMVVTNNNEAIVFDTPTNNENAAQLIKWINETLHCKINAIIPTHFHDDCLGGLQAFHEQAIPSYAYFKTIELAKANNAAVPQNSFSDSLVLKVGTKSIIAKFFGEGHTKDNIVGYFPSEKVLFGGCLIKEVNASKGYLGDANLATWSATVEKVKMGFAEVQVVVPGHGDWGGKQLLEYTIKLFKPL